MVSIQFVHAHGTVSKSVTYDVADHHTVPWLQDVRLVEFKNSFVVMEPSSMPVVAIGRALTHHLKMCGVLDGYDPDTRATAPCDVFCKLSMALANLVDTYHIVAEFGYRYRNAHETGERMGLTESDIALFLYDRIVEGSRAHALTEMKVKHYLALELVSCQVNGLDIVL